MLYQLLFEPRHCIFKAGDPTKLLFSLYDNTTKQFITEQYCLHLSEHNFPTVGSPDDVKLIFKDIPDTVLCNDIYIICYIYRIGRMDAPDVMRMDSQRRRPKRLKRYLLRPFGCAVFKLKDSMQQLRHQLGTPVIIEPNKAPVCCPKNEREFNQLPIDIINNDTVKAWYPPPISLGIVHCYTLYKGSMSQCRTQYKGNFDKLTCIETLKVFDSQSLSKRHVLYVKILSAEVCQRNKRASCNVCVEMTLKHNSSYEQKQNCIRFGKSDMAVPANKGETVIFYHNNSPILNQLFTVMLPNDDAEMEQYHLHFACWHVRANPRRPRGDDERGFGLLKLSDIIHLARNTGHVINVPLYRCKPCNKYVESYELENLVSSGCKSMNVEIRYVSTMKRYFYVLVMGYIKRIDGLPIDAVPYDLVLLLLMFVK
eukprot:341666_1